MRQRGKRQTSYAMVRVESLAPPQRLLAIAVVLRRGQERRVIAADNIAPASGAVGAGMRDSGSRHLLGKGMLYVHLDR